MPLKIASWNVNSIKIRAEAVAQWLREAQPDVVCLQEIKCQDEGFPRTIFEDAGYNLSVHGQKSYNGVAILSKWQISEVTAGLPTLRGDDQARYLEAVIGLPGEAIRVASIYLPNGNPPEGAKYDYKLDWLAALREHARTLLTHEETLILGGDYNVIPEAADVYDPAAWRGDALGNLVCRATARNFNPVMATAADVTIAEVEELVETGSLNADRVDTPGIYVQSILQGSHYEKRLQTKRLRSDRDEA